MMLRIPAVIFLLCCSGCSHNATPSTTPNAPLREHARYLVNTLIEAPHQLIRYTHAPRCRESSCLRTGIDTAHKDLTRLLFGQQPHPDTLTSWQLHTKSLDYTDLNHAKALIYAQHPALKSTNAIRINLIYVDEQWKLDLSQYIDSLQPEKTRQKP